ncbi:MAG: hypothetical protein AVDCRST_MAG69-1339, partial [uncultured Solirubrobacteraceae bacterium]
DGRPPAHRRHRRTGRTRGGHLPPALLPVRRRAGPVGRAGRRLRDVPAVVSGHRSSAERGDVGHHRAGGGCVWQRRPHGL